MIGRVGKIQYTYVDTKLSDNIIYPTISILSYYLHIYLQKSPGEKIELSAMTPVHPTHIFKPRTQQTMDP